MTKPLRRLRNLLIAGVILAALVHWAALPQAEAHGWAWLVLLGLAYFAPTFVARQRDHHQRRAIFVLNLFLGWTLLGWVGALVWAFTAVPARAEVRS